MFGPEEVLRGGLRVYTDRLTSRCKTRQSVWASTHVARLSGEGNIGQDASDITDCPALEFLPPMRASDVGVDHEISNAAMVALDRERRRLRPCSAVSIIGMREIDGSFNVAVDGVRQPGSAFKTVHLFDGAKPRIYGGYDGP